MDDHALAADIAREAGELLVELQARQVGKDEGDRLSNDLILARLAVTRPDDAILSEEGSGDTGRTGTDRLGRDRVWIVDPLDGTTNFLHGIPQFAISIGLERSGAIVAGVIYNPITDEMFVAERGKGFDPEVVDALAASRERSAA